MSPAPANTCARCFERPGTRHAGRAPLCDVCRPILAAELELIRAARERRAERLRERARNKPPALVRYGLDRDHLEAIHAAQLGCCPLCQRKIRITTRGAGGGTRAVVDHCHRTGVVRGLLCSRCNTRIGWMNDNAGYAERIVEYLRRGRYFALNPNHPRGPITRKDDFPT